MTTQTDHFSDEDVNLRKLPSGLNVLTILSFIGCALQLYSTVSGYLNAKTQLDEKDKVLEQFRNPDMPKWAKTMIGNPDQFVTMVTKSYENRLPIMILGLVSIGLCIYGVINMRKLKKEGLLFYTIGELLPILTMVIFIGTFVATGVIFIFGSLIALVFIALYASYKKRMIF